jgi:hypothetical protein
LDKALNVTHRTRTGYGTYPNPVAKYAITPGDYGVQNRTVSEVINNERCYSIPFTPEALDKIRDLGLQFEGKVGYSVTSPNGMRLTVSTYEDLRDGSFEELCAVGHKMSPTEKQRWLDEGGAAAVSKKHEQFIANRDNKDAPQKPVTADQVRQMIQEESKPKSNSKTK